MFGKMNSFHQSFNNPIRGSLTLKEEGPLNLIEFRRDKIILNEEAIKVLNEVKDNIIIVSIFGKEHTGKSYLLNLLLNSRENSKISKGFKVLSTFNAGARGIWMWNTPIGKPNSKEKIILIDSQGINSENVYNQNSDSKVFALILLISSVFIYNTIGDINSNSLNELELLVHLADSVAITNKVNKDNLISGLCPKFIWALRDFDLEKLSPQEGEKMTPDTYMEQCITERFDGKNKDEINLIKVNLIKYFKERECITLPSPVKEEKDLHTLKRLQFNDLESNFKDQFNKLRNKIFIDSQSKTINGKAVNGPIIAYLLTSFINEINNDNIPNIINIFNEMAIYDIENHYYYSKILFKQRLEELKEDELDIDFKEIYSLKYESLKEYMKILERNPDIYKKDIFFKEYYKMKEKLEKIIEEKINNELKVLISDNTYENLFTERDKTNTIKSGKRIDDLIEDYLNELSEIKINSTNSILNNKTLDSFINDDIKKTQNIIEYIQKNKEFSTLKSTIQVNDEEKSKYKETNSPDDDIEYNKEYETLKTELEANEKKAIELIGKYTNLMDKRDKCLRNSMKPSSALVKHNIKSYSSKLVNIYYNEEKLCDLSSEEKESSENCNCNLKSLKCKIF
jgi:hypothetical protein